MMENLVKLFWLTDEAPGPHTLFCWRLVVSMFMTLILVFVVFAFGGLWKLGGFALADDIDTKVAEAIKPVNDRLTTIEAEQGTQSGYLKHLVKSDLERLINREVLARCQATDSVAKQRIKDHIDAYQKDYEEVFGHEYGEPDCEDV